MVAVGPVALPAYLDRSGIVVRRAGDEIVISTGHRWGEPLGDGLAVDAAVPQVLALHAVTLQEPVTAPTHAGSRRPRADSSPR